MTRSAAPEIVRRALMRHGFAGASDATLLVRYARHHDDAAFAELVERYAPLVWGVCRRACSDSHAAEDAFQATFIALARQAASLRRAECLPGWLHGVARRAAWRARAKARATEAVPDVPVSGPTLIEQASASELLAAVEAEVARLPEKHRSAVLLCWFEDGSLDDAARRLGVSKGVLWGRLKRGRERLRQRLTARGFGPAVVLAAAVLTGMPAAAQLIRRTTAAAVAPAVGAPTGLLGSWAFWKLGGVLGVAAAVVAAAVTLMPAGAPEPPKESPPKWPATAEVAANDGFPLPEGAVRRFGNRQARHPDTITGSAVSPDGKRLATIGGSTVVIWDTATMSATCVIPNQIVGRYGNGRVEFFPDSKSLLLAVGPEQYVANQGFLPQVEAVHVFDVETGKLKFAINNRQDFYARTWLTAGGKEIATFTLNAVNFWDARDGKPLRSLAIKMDVEGYPVFAEQANLIASRSRRAAKLIVVDANTGKAIYDDPAEEIAGIAFSPDGRRLAVQEVSGKFTIHDPIARKKLLTFDHPIWKAAGPVLFSADQQILYFGDKTGEINRWDLKNNRRLPKLVGRPSWILSSIALSPDESTLYSMGFDQLIRRWDLKTLKQIPSPDGYVAQTVIALMPHGKSIIIADYLGAIDEWDLATGKRLRRIQDQQTDGFECVAVSADGKRLAAGRTGQDVQLWDLAAGKLERTIPIVEKPDQQGGDPVKRLAFDPTGKILLTGSEKTGVSAFDVASGRRLWNAPNNGPALAVDPHGRWVAAESGTSIDVKWTLLNPITGEVVRRVDVLPAKPTKDAKAWPNCEPHVTDMNFTNDGSRLVSGHYDRTLRFWDPLSGKELSIIMTSKSLRVGSAGVAVSRDGRWVGVGRVDRLITIWEMETGKLIHTLTGHDSPVTQVAFTRDGRGLVSNADLSPVLWDLCPKDLPTDGLWDLLASDDAAKAYRAQWALIRDPAAAVKLLRDKVKLAELAVSRVTFDKWVAALDSPQFRAREAAEKELMMAGSNVPVSWLRKSLADSKAEEPRTRLTRVVAQREKGPDPTAWRLSRAVQVLELAGTAEARALLKKWSEVEGSPLADDVAGALRRLKK